MSTPLPGSDLPETQWERTLLAWRRTMIGVLAVLGIGGIHISVSRHPWLGALAGALSLIAIIPMLSRINQLRRRAPGPAAWQPLALVIGLLGLAACLLVLG